MNNISVRTSLVVGVLTVLMLGLCWVWLDRVSNELVDHEEQERATSTANTLVASLQSIMLSGSANIAQDWIHRVSSLPDVAEARVYRTDGKEAFADHATLKAVNDWLGERQFERPDTGRPPAEVAGDLAGLFAKAADGDKPVVSAKGMDGVTLLYPIRADKACLQCHGYDEHKNRGVLVLTMSPGQSVSTVDALRSEALVIFFAAALLLVIAVWIYTQGAILSPLNRFAETARRIGEGERLLRFETYHDDEFGVLAASSNELLDQLEEEIARENQLRLMQQGMVDAVISLSTRVASEDVLRRVGELAQQMTRARYAMLGYKDSDGEMHFIALGMDEASQRKIGHPPVGKGLLSLLWSEGRTVRVDNIAAHAASVGFPEGHPSMQYFLGSPIRFGEEVIGALYLTDRDDDVPFSELDQQVVEALCAACAVALANARAMDVCST